MIALLLACHADVEDVSWAEDVQPIAERSCAGCHASGGVGGLELTGLADWQKWSDLIYEAVSSRTMPPWQADDACNTYEGQFSLSESEITTILTWLDAGAPGGDVASSSGSVVDARWVEPALERVDHTLLLPTDYTPQGDPDDYRCFLMEWPYEETVWVSGYAFRPGNEAIVHHVIPYIVEPESAETYRALDEADPDPGYACYGTPGGDIEALVRARWLGAWAPGSGASVLPEGAGLEIRPGSLVALQMHYYSTGEEGTDRSAFDLQIETEPQAWADLQPWTDVQWVLGNGMDIPAQSDDVTHSFSYAVQDDEDFFIHSASLHMHDLGSHASFTVMHPDGSEDCILDLPVYDFNWQRSYRLQDPVWVEPGDVVKLSCTWDNPTDAVVSWGDGTGDEMCLAVTLITGD